MSSIADTVSYSFVPARNWSRDLQMIAELPFAYPLRSSLMVSFTESARKLSSYYALISSQKAFASGVFQGRFSGDSRLR